MSEIIERPGGIAVRRRADIIEALTREFANAYLVNLETGGYDLFRMDKLFRNRFRNVLRSSYTETVEAFAEAAVYSHDREEFLHQTDLTFVREVLSRQEEFSFTFRIVREEGLQYYRGKYVRIGGKYTPLREAIIGFADIQEEREEEISRQELLENALERARKADNAKSAFLSNMSHDIRTPMTSILGLCAVANEHAEDPKRVRECLAQIRISGDHLLRLIGDILDMTRIESGRLDMDEEWNSTEKLLSDASDMIRPLADGKRIQYSVKIAENVPSIFFCDKVRMMQLLMNLLSNAVKYTPEGGSVILEAETGKPYLAGAGVVLEPAGPVPPETGLILKIRDNGIGISEDFLPRLFVPFERENNSTMSGVLGTGLGLPICRGIIESMKGTISVCSEPGKGSTFMVWLPLPEDSTGENSIPGQNKGTLPGEKAPSQVSLFGMGRKRELRALQSAQGTNPNASGVSSVRLLLVEDNALNREILAELLEEEGYLVETAQNGKEALDRIMAEGSPVVDAVLMDLQMPVMDGYEATRRIRALPDRKLSGIPIIALTADAFEEDRKRCREAEMDAYISKPVEMESIRYVLEHV